MDPISHQCQRTYEQKQKARATGQQETQQQKEAKWVRPARAKTAQPHPREQCEQSLHAGSGSNQDQADFHHANPSLALPKPKEDYPRSATSTFAVVTT